MVIITIMYVRDMNVLHPKIAPRKIPKIVQTYYKFDWAA